MDTIRCIALFAILLAASLVRGEEQAAGADGLWPATRPRCIVPTSEENEPAYSPIMMTLRVVQFTGATRNSSSTARSALNDSGVSLTTLDGDGRESCSRQLDEFAAQDFVTNDNDRDSIPSKLSGDDALGQPRRAPSANWPPASGYRCVSVAHFSRRAERFNSASSC